MTEFHSPMEAERAQNPSNHNSNPMFRSLSDQEYMTGLERALRDILMICDGIGIVRDKITSEPVRYTLENRELQVSRIGDICSDWLTPGA